MHDLTHIELTPPCLVRVAVQASPGLPRAPGVSSASTTPTTGDIGHDAAGSPSGQEHAAPLARVGDRVNIRRERTPGCA